MQLWTLNPSTPSEPTGDLRPLACAPTRDACTHANTFVATITCFGVFLGIIATLCVIVCAYSGAVLSLAMGEDGDSCYSGGLDGTVRCWKIPDLNVDPYDNYGQSLTPV